MEKILQDIRDERAYQKSKWSAKYNDLDWTNEDWTGFILEYLPNAKNPVPLRHTDYDFRKQLVKVAALAVAAIEATDARK